jgi:hypothetical protein
MSGLEADESRFPMLGKGRGSAYFERWCNSLKPRHPGFEIFRKRLF